MSYTSLGLYIDRGAFNTSTAETVFAKHRYENTDDTLATIATADYFPDYLGQDASEVKIGDLLTLRGSDDYRDYKITGVVPLTIVEEVLGDNPFDQSLNTGDTVEFADVTISGLGLGVVHSSSGGVLSSSSVTNAETTATSANTASAIVARDGSGNFAAGTITAATFAATTGVTLPTTGGTPAVLAAYETGTFNATFADPFAVTQVVPVTFVRLGGMVMMRLPETFATSDTAALATSDVCVPARIRPITGNSVGVISRGQDNTTITLLAVAVDATGVIEIGTTTDGAVDAFTNTGTAGWYETYISYNLN